MYYGKLPNGITQAMNLKTGDVVDWHSHKGWTVDEIGYGYFAVRLWVHCGESRAVWDLHPDDHIGLVTPSPSRSK